jgi:dTMP kinase
MFITLDGIDGGGKSTQVARLCDFLRDAGHRVVAVRDPGGTPTGEAIRSLLLDSDLSMNRRSEAMLFMAARGELVHRVIRPAIADGAVVVSDRFLLANVVYQSIASDAMAGDLSTEDLWHIGQWATGGLRPDITLLLDLPADVAMARIDRPADRMESRGIEYLASVRQAFLSQLPHASLQTQVIDASQSPDQVQQDIRAAVLACIA